MIGHTPDITAFMARFVCTFHVPLFYFFSGYFIKDESPVNAITKKDARRLLIPFFVTALMIVLLSAVRAAFTHKDVWSDIFQRIQAIPYGVNFMWFIPALFVARFCIHYTNQFGKYQALLIGIIAYVGYKSIDYYCFPFCLQAGMTGSLYLYAGKLFKKYDIPQRLFSAGKIIPYCFASGLWVFCIIFCGDMFLKTNRYAAGMLDIIGSFAAILCISWVSMLIEKCLPCIGSGLAAIGRSTLPILCVHEIESALFPWDTLFATMHVQAGWILRLSLRITLIAAVCFLIYMIPFSRKLFFPGNNAKSVQS